MEESYLQRAEDGTVVGMVRTEFGRLFEYTDLSLFAEEVKDDPPPYLEFITRPPSDVVFPVDWSRIPEATTDLMLPHQKEAVRRSIEEHDGKSLLAVGMGLGKTMIGCILAHHYEKNTLFIVPASKLSDWAKEWDRWIGTGKLQVLRGSAAEIKSDRVIVAFDTAKNHKEVLRAEWGCVIVDESQYLNTNSARSRKLIPMLQRAHAVILLSGTPERNRPSEMYNTFRILHPEVFTDRMVFTKRYSNGHFDNRNKWQEDGAKHLEELNIMLSTLMYRVTIQEALPNLVSKTRHMVRFKCADEKDAARLEELQVERRRLREKEEKSQTPREQDRARMARNVHSNLIRMAAGQIKSRVAEEWIVALLNEHPDDKIVLFVKHKLLVEVYGEMMSRHNVRHIAITGDTSLKRRAERVEMIRDPSHPARVAVVTLDSCGTGITLCPGANIVVFGELDYTPSMMEQAEERVYRITAVKPVKTYWMVLENSTDDSIINKLQAKFAVNSAVVDGNKRARLEFTN